MLTKEDYCDYDTCVALMGIGYPSYVFGDKLQDEHFANISLYEAQKFLREGKGLHVEVSIFANNYDVEIITTNGDKHGFHDVFIEKCGFKSYEEALSEGIKEAVKILKEN